MPINYTGLPSNVQAPATAALLLDDPIISLPVDLTDDVAAASIAQAFKLLADYATLTKNFLKSYFGDGSDGNVVVSGVVTLTRHMYYDTLTVQAGGDLQTNGWRVYCKTGLVWTGGKISCNGENASGFSPGGASITVGPHARGKGGAGGQGAVVGSASPGVGASTLSGTSGASGGSSTGGTIAGGAAGDASVDALGYKIPPFFVGSPGVANGMGNGAQNYAGSPGGGGGGGAAGPFNGGGGGQGAGFIFIIAKTITISGAPTTEVIGGNGAAASGGNAGGGGGGCGGVAFAIYASLTGAFPAVTATRGSAGAGVGTGTAGVQGYSGTATWKGVAVFS